ncbi:hypothetical protein AVEN_57842-1 [Araneus ventricosus]|uniref:Uncharacterized protein n=1 Tax=Araneus ventricosus TaxID=182803 RepID=A0A4Y2W2R1_ARAVE|nr:hypothetical protein AVEN_57842-1 [Araneus ventricosus]
MCSICSRNLNETSFVSCSSCSMKIDITCIHSVASTSEDNNFVYHCDICDRKKSNGASNSTRRPEKSSGKNDRNLWEETETGCSLRLYSVKCPESRPWPFRLSNLIGKILKVENNAYQIRTKSGIIKSWFVKCDFQISGSQILEDVPENYISVLEALANESKFGGQRYSIFKCSVSNKKCVCKKANQPCSSKCHESSSCGNK